MCIRDSYTIIQNTEAENAKEKLKKILYQLGTDSKTHELDSVLTSQMINPYFVVDGLQASMKQDAPIISRLIEEGIKDGSLQTTQPKMCIRDRYMSIFFHLHICIYKTLFIITVGRWISNKKLSIRF